jgi:hypothetical protein
MPKDEGGLGITNTKIMNVALMVKLIWRLFSEPPDSSLWHQIIRAKYPGAENIFNSTANGGSPFWHSLHKIKDFFKLGARFKLGNGERIHFWTDLWTGDSPLCSRFLCLFQIASEPGCLVSQVFLQGRWEISFRRTGELAGSSD